jgi:MerR family transcriptional regulator, light-induced transcriptional regulator
MKSYQIADLQRLTGINVHTIRMWERRYGLITPHRTQTNIRYYDDEQVKKLLNVSTLLHHGMKISRIAELSDTQLNSHIRDLGKVAEGDVVCTGFINDLTASMLSFDEQAFEKSFSAAIVRFGLYEAMLRVFYPFMRNAGLMWVSNEAMPVQEHFASAVIRRKLIAAIDGLSVSSRKSKVFLLFLPSEEWHETGLLFADYIIRSNGYKTIYLGQNVPMDNLQQVIEQINPTHFLTFYITPQKADKVQAEVSLLAKNNKHSQILISGADAILQSIKKAKNVSFLTSPQDLIGFLKR